MTNVQKEMDINTEALAEAIMKKTNPEPVKEKEEIKVGDVVEVIDSSSPYMTVNKIDNEGNATCLYFTHEDEELKKEIQRIDNLKMVDESSLNLYQCLIGIKKDPDSNYDHIPVIVIGESSQTTKVIKKIKEIRNDMRFMKCKESNNYALSQLTIIEQHPETAQFYQLRNYAKNTCKKCHGRGHVGYDEKKEMYYPCNCAITNLHNQIRKERAEAKVETKIN